MLPHNNVQRMRCDAGGGVLAQIPGWLGCVLHRPYRPHPLCQRFRSGTADRQRTLLPRA